MPANTSQEELNEMLGVMESKSGEGMESGMNNSAGSGTGSSGDSSAGNKENA
ncbi:hypothetical protein D3C81_2242820 [compost metagenome]